MVRLYLFVLIASLTLFGCSADSRDVTTIDPKETYQGYPCFDVCPSFQAGYDAAKTKELTQKTACQNFETSERLGCEAYVNDLEIDTLDNGGFNLAH